MYISDFLWISRNFLHTKRFQTYLLELKFNMNPLYSIGVFLKIIKSNLLWKSETVNRTLQNWHDRRQAKLACLIWFYKYQQILSFVDQDRPRYAGEPKCKSVPVNSVCHGNWRAQRSTTNHSTAVQLRLLTFVK